MPNFFAHILRVKARTSYKLFIALSSFSLLFSSFTPWIQPLAAQAQTGGGSTVTYLPVALTSNNNTALYMQITAQNYANGKWTYKVEYSRTLNLQASLYISPKTDKTAAVGLTCSTGSIATALSSGGGNTVGRTGSCTFALNPATRYRLEFYQQPSAGGQLMLRKFFNTLSTTGQPLATSQIPVAQGGTLNSSTVDTPTPTPTTVGNSSSCPQGMVVVGMTNSVPPAYICAAPTPTPTRTPTPTPTLYPCTNSSNCPPATNPNYTPGVAAGSRDFGSTMLVNVYTSNPPTGLNYPVEPQIKEVFNAGNVGPKSSNLAGLTDPATGNLILNISSAKCWNGTTDPYVTCDQKAKFTNTTGFREDQEVWVYGTVGRKFVSSFYGPKCDDPTVKIEKSLNLPSGISLTSGCTSDLGGAGNIILGTMSGIPDRLGVYKNEFRVTKTNADGTQTTALTRVYFKIMNHGTITINFQDTNGAATNTAAIGSRVILNMTQTNSVNPFPGGDLDLWAVKDGSPDVNPETTYFNYTNNQDSRIYLGRVSVDPSYLGCNASTAGGSGPLLYGCMRYNWLVGDGQSRNLTTGNYAIFATTRLPYVDRDGSAAGIVYGECQIDYAGCTGFAWGGATLNITAGTLPSEAPTYNPGTSNVASFGMLTIKASVTKYNADGSQDGPVQTSSIGQSGTDNSSVQGCFAGNDTGGVECPGPVLDTSLKAGQKMKFDWDVYVPNTQYIDVRYATADTKCNVVDVVNSGGYWTGGEGKSCGNGSPIGGIMVRKGEPTLFTGAVDSTIKAYGAVSSDYVGPTDTQTTLVRQCSSFMIPGGFDYTPAQGYINGAHGSYTTGNLSAQCARILRGVEFGQTLNVHLGLNGGGETIGHFGMGGMRFGGSCIGLNDVDICPAAINLQTNGFKGTGFFGSTTCNVPDQDKILDILGLNIGLYNTDARVAINANGGNVNDRMLVEFTPFIGGTFNPGWKFDNAQIIVSGNGVNKTMDLGNSSDPRWLKNLTSNTTINGKSIACYYSSLNCGVKTYVSTPEFTGLAQASSYNVTMRFTCSGTNPSGVNYRDAVISGVTANENNAPVVTPPGTSSSCPAPGACSSNYKNCKIATINYSDLNVCSSVTSATYTYDAVTCGGNCNGTGCPGGDGSVAGGKCPAPASGGSSNNYFSVSSCYLPTTYQTDLGLNCTKSGSSATVRFNSIPSTWKYGSLAAFGDSLSKVESGCAGGTGHCSFENWNVSSSPLNITNTAGINPYWVRLIFYCQSDPKGYASVGVQCN